MNRPTSGSGAPGPWLTCRGLDPRAELLLLCLPYAGGSAGIFRDWPALFPSRIQVCPVQLPGRAERSAEPPIADCRELAAALARAVAPALDRPFALFGHSMGALIGFEAARVLQDELGRTAEHLFVSACAAPHVHHEDDALHHLPGPEFREGLIRLGGVPSAVLDSPELMEIVEPMLRADFAVSERYSFREGRALGCPVVAFTGQDDPYVSVEDVGLWREHASSGFEMLVVPGGHFFMNDARELMAGTIARRLAA